MGSSFKGQEIDQITMESSDFSYFGNQISGHSCLLKGSTNPQYLYKPYNRNEADFYEFISKSKDHVLSSFIPTYYGTFNLPESILEEFASRICREDTIFEEYEESSNKVEIQPCTPEPSQDCETRSGNGESRTEWFKNLFTTRFNRSNTRFLKLQDLTSDSESPCMLDLKMGSVAYNANKLAHQANKLSKTTSSSLKFRICGLHTKNPKTDTEYFRDKYWGRRLKSDGIHNALALFFYDGQSIRRNLIKQFLRLLLDLANAIKMSTGFKFYSVSLLLIYDSSVDDEDFEDDEYAETYLKDKLKLKLIDFANTKYGQPSNEPDIDLLTGVENLTKSFAEILDNPDLKPCLV